MTKYLFLLASLVCGVALFTSCGSDDEPSGNYKASATYTITFTDDLVSAASPIIIYYKGTNNQTKRDIVTTKTWTKTIESDRFPVEFGYMIDAQSKDISELTKEKYNLGFDSSIAVQVTENGSEKYRQTFNNNYSGEAKKDAVANAVSRSVNGKHLGVRITKDRNNNISSSTVTLDYDL